jgi:uncharacterized damage-inducible protein DinB
MDLAYLASHWANVRAGLIATIDKFGDGELDFQPFPTSWTARQIMLHVAQEENGELNLGITQTMAEFPPEYPIEDYPSRAAIQDLLASVHARSVDFLDSISDDDLKRTIATPWGASYCLVEMIGHLIEHEIHHRAELSLILGMLGRAGLDA